MEKVNGDVDKLNNGLKNICIEKELIFVDINKILSTDGFLKSEYTCDGIHLSGLGYKEWGTIILPIIKAN